MRSLAINFARAINAATRGRGKVFEYRYHARQITTPRQARNSLAYVLRGSIKRRVDEGSRSGDLQSLCCAFPETRLGKWFVERAAIQSHASSQTALNSWMGCWVAHPLRFPILIRRETSVASSRD